MSHPPAKAIVVRGRSGTTDVVDADLALIAGRADPTALTTDHNVQRHLPLHLPTPIHDRPVGTSRRPAPCVTGRPSG